MAAIIRTRRDDYSGDLMRTHEDGTISVLRGSLHETGYWASDPKYVTRYGHPKDLDERGNGVCGTCGEPVPHPIGPWDGETERGGYSVHYSNVGARVTSIRCPRHRDFTLVDPETGERLD